MKAAKKQVIAIKMGSKLTLDAISLDVTGVYINVWVFSSLAELSRKLDVDKSQLYYFYKKRKKIESNFIYEGYYIIVRKANAEILP